jgi:transcription elongation factor GreA
MAVSSVMQKIPMTMSGHARLEEELRNLKSVERPAVIEAIAEARSHGDLSENAEYHAARERQSFIEGRIMDLEDKISRADVLDPAKIAGNIIKFGATVTVIDEDTKEKKTYQIVGEYEADFEKGLLALTAPLSRALIGKKAGDSVEVTTPKGSKAYEVVSVEYR